MKSTQSLSLCLQVVRPLAVSLILFGFAGANMAHAQTGTSSYGRIELTQGALPRGFKGYSCSAIASRVRALSLQKGEFETSETFADRLAAARAKPIAGSVTLGDLLAFVKTDLEPKYDADKQAMMVSLRGGRQFLESRDYVSLLLEVLRKSTREYVGSNAMGARARVTSYESKVCGVVFANVPDRYPGPAWNDFVKRTPVPMQPTEARALKGKLAAAYIGILEQPFLFDYLEYIKPTISSPTEVTRQGAGLVLKLLEIWVFDRDSGAVLLKIKQDVNTVTSQVYAPMPESQASATGNSGSERPEPSTAVAASLNSRARAQAYDDPICGNVMPFAEAAYHAFERGVAQSDAVAHASTAAPQFSNYWRAFIEKAYGAASVEEAKAAVYSQCLTMKPN
jgi:hypothetical protein